MLNGVEGCNLQAEEKVEGEGMTPEEQDPNGLGSDTTWSYSEVSRLTHWIWMFEGRSHARAFRRGCQRWDSPWDRMLHGNSKVWLVACLIRERDLQHFSRVKHSETIVVRCISVSPGAHLFVVSSCEVLSYRDIG